MIEMMVVLVGVLLFSGLCVATAAAGQRMLKDDGRLRLREAIGLAHRAFVLPDRRTASATAQAIRRCVGCPDSVSCDLRLAEGDWQKLKGFCPNAGYVESLPRG